MAAREVAVKKYVVRLSAEERERLEALRTKGKIPPRRLTKALILLKADVSDAGEGWSDWGGRAYVVSSWTFRKVQGTTSRPVAISWQADAASSVWRPFAYFLMPQPCSAHSRPCSGEPASERPLFGVCVRTGTDRERALWVELTHSRRPRGTTGI